MEALPQDLADFLVTKNFDPEYFDKQGQPSEAGDATTIKFDYVADSGKNYGTAVCVVADNELSLYYGDNLGRGMEPEDKDEWYSFLEQLSNQASSHSATWTPTEINKLKHNLAGIAAIKEGLFEGYYGNRKVSYMGEQTQARLVINHNRVLGEEDKRYRYVESLFIETADQERFRLPFKSLGGGRAMLEHVRSGGRPYDVRGNHITEVVSEMAVLSRFNRAQHHRVYEGVTQELVESARQYYHNLQETVRHLGSPRGYQAYFESWAPDHVGEAESLVENLRDLFVEQTLDARIEAALPTLAKIQQQGNNMKEAQIFENWINNLSEGTWALPETPEQQEKLNQLMSAELIVGPDATNATEQLYDIVGDDELFDILNDLADQSEGRANIWDDSDVQRRLAELGVQTPQSTETAPADVPQDTAPAVKEQGMAEATGDQKFDTMMSRMTAEPKYPDKQMIPTSIPELIQWADQNNKPYHKFFAQWAQKHRFTNVNDALVWVGDNIDPYDEFGPKDYRDAWDEYDVGEPLIDAAKHDPKAAELLKVYKCYEEIVDDWGDDYRQMNMKEGDNLATFAEDAELAEMLKYAGVPIKENVLTDSTGSTLEHIKDTYKRDVKDFMQTGEMSRHLEQVLYDYYYDDMPYGAKTGEDIDTHEWIGDRFAEDLGINENLISPMIMPVSEGSCNMTAEGSYCPEHGLAECGSMYEDGRPGLPPKLNPRGKSQAQIDDRMTSVGFIPGTRDHARAGEEYRAANPNTARPVSKPLPRSDIQGTDLGPHSQPVRVDVRGYGPEPDEFGRQLGSSPNPDIDIEEGVNDPINSNSAITGAYYEGKETPTQEGDALLARIKSLALLR